MKRFQIGYPETLLTGIVLSTAPMFESDRRVELLTEHRGRVSLLAKGAAASVKRFGGRLEPTTVITATCRPRANLWVMTDASVLQLFPGIRTHYDAIVCAMYMIELVRKVTINDQPHDGLYTWLNTVLAAIDRSPRSVKQIQRRFEQQLLELEGICPVPYLETKFMAFFSEYTGQWVNPPGYIDGV